MSDTTSPTIDRNVVDRFLAEDRIAFIGAHRDSKQFANSVYRHLRGGDRTLLPVHPDADSIEGDPCVASIAALPDPIDAALVMVKPEAARTVVDECIARGITQIWLHRGAGAGAVSDEAIAACEAADVAVIGGACPMMFAEPVGWFHKLHRLAVKRRIRS
jgi:uncharacterized protein